MNLFKISKEIQPGILLFLINVKYKNVLVALLLEASSLTVLTESFVNCAFDEL